MPYRKVRGVYSDGVYFAKTRRIFRRCKINTSVSHRLVKIRNEKYDFQKFFRVRRIVIADGPGENEWDVWPCVFVELDRQQSFTDRIIF